MMKVEWEALKRLNRPYFEELRSEISEIEEDCHYILGNNVEKFEKKAAEYLGVKYAIAVGNCLDALTISLKALKLPEHSEVIVPSNTFYASVLAIIRAGLTPVLCEPDLDTFNIKGEEIEKLINEKTKAILVVHLYGNPCEMDKICRLARKYKLKIVEDCAQAFGAEYKGRKTGSFGDLGAFSFYPTKNLGGIGDGGLITTNNHKLYSFCKLARSYGGSNYKYDILGINSRMDDIQAAFLLNKLIDIDKLNDKKIENAKLYFKNITNKNVILPTVNERSVFHIFCLRVKNRDKFMKYLKENGIDTLIHYPIPIYKQKALKGYISKKYPISDELSNTIISLPCSAAHNEEEIEYVIDVINKYEG